MKKSIAFCLITILMLSSGCIGWADNNPSISSSEEPVVKALEELSAKPVEKEILNKPEEVTRLNTLVKPDTIDNPEKPLPEGSWESIPDGPLQPRPETQMPVKVLPDTIDLSTLLPNQLFSKTISIYNPNQKSAKVFMMLRNKENIQNISVKPTKLTVPANGTSKVIVSGVVPFADNYSAELVVSNLLSDDTATCLIYSASTVSSGPKNVKVTYSSTSEDYTITWDPMTGDIDHYNIYVWNNKWDLLTESTEPKYVRHYIVPEVAKDLRIMVTGVDSNGNDTNGTEAKWDGVVEEKPISPPRNVRITYDFDSKLHSIFWDPPESGTVLKYRIEYTCRDENNRWVEHQYYTTNTNFGIVGMLVSQNFQVSAKSTTGVYSNLVYVHSIPAVREVNSQYNREKEELKLMWEKPVDYVFRFKVYSSYNGGTYLFEEQLGSQEDCYAEDFTYIKKGVKAEDFAKYKFKIVSLQTHAGEERKINLRDFSLTKENLTSTKRIDAHINIHDNIAHVSWNAIPGTNSYKVYGAINGGSYSLLRIITGKTECVLSSPAPYDPPRDINMKIKVKAGTDIYAWPQEDAIETITFTWDPIHPRRP